jgi:hypothetical protein
MGEDFPFLRQLQRYRVVPSQSLVRFMFMPRPSLSRTSPL